MVINKSGKETSRYSTKNDDKGHLTESYYDSYYSTNKSKYQYDSNGRLVKETYEQQDKDRASENGLGKLYKGTITYKYDSNDRRIYEMDKNNEYYTEISYKYDSNGDLTQSRRKSNRFGYETDVTILYKYEYDNQNRKKKEIVDYSDYVITYDYTYYGNGMIKTQKATTTSNSGITHETLYEYSMFGFQTKTISYSDANYGVEYKVMVYNLNN